MLKTQMEGEQMVRYAPAKYTPKRRPARRTQQPGGRKRPYRDCQVGRGVWAVEQFVFCLGGNCVGASIGGVQ